MKTSKTPDPPDHVKMGIDILKYLTLEKRFYSQQHGNSWRSDKFGKTLFMEWGLCKHGNSLTQKKGIDISKYLTLEKHLYSRQRGNSWRRIQGQRVIDKFGKTLFIEWGLCKHGTCAKALF